MNRDAAASDWQTGSANAAPIGKGPFMQEPPSQYNVEKTSRNAHHGLKRQLQAPAHHGSKGQLHGPKQCRAQGSQSSQGSHAKFGERVQGNRLNIGFSKGKGRSDRNPRKVPKEVFLDLSKLERVGMPLAFET